MHDLVLLFCTLVLMPIIEISQVTVLRTVFGLLYVAFLTGYGLIAAVFPGREDLEWLERLGLAFILSISAVSLTGFLLNFTTWGIRLTTILISLNSLTLLACVVAYWRRRRLPAEERLVVHVKLRLPDWQKADRFNRILASILVLAISAAIASLLYTAIMPGPQETYTEFYVLGADRKLGGSSQVTTGGESVAVILGVVNHEHADVSYHIERVGPSGAEPVAAIQLAHEEIWEQPYTFTLTHPGADQRIEFLLYREDDQEPYRSLYLWITDKENEPNP